MTLLDALLHFRNGNGSPVTLPFSEVNTYGLRPIDYDCVKDFVANCHTPGSYHVVGTKAVPARGQIRLVLGDVTATLDGTITYTGHCNWSFEGTMSGADDPAGSVPELYEPIKREVLSKMIRILMGNKKRSFH